jgi:hypothetical protein
MRKTALLAWAGALLLAPAAASGAVTSAQIVRVINAERSANHLPPVREDPALSAGCAQYDNYRRINGRLENAFTLHGEEATKTGYTQAGARAARGSIVNAGDRPADSFAAGDVFDDAPNHLVALMDPAVAVIGADQTDFELGIFGTVSVSCIDIRSAPPRAKPRRLHVYTYVGPNGQAPRNPVYREGPRGHGTFVFLYFDAPRSARLTLRSLRIRRHNGTRVKPAFVQVSGGMKDGRRQARQAISRGVAQSPTPTVWTRIEEEQSPEERRVEEEEHVQPETFKDFMEYKVLEALTRAVEHLGFSPVTFK